VAHFENFKTSAEEQSYYRQQQEVDFDFLERTGCIANGSNTYWNDCEPKVQKACMKKIEAIILQTAHT